MGMKYRSRWPGVLALGAVLVAGAAYGQLAPPPSPDAAKGRQMAQQAVKEPHLWITADHKQHEALKKKFASGPEVTKACLSCHNQAGLQFHKTIHWTWMDPNEAPERKVGKGGLTVNNFCVALKSNEPRCTSCHAGYGWKDKGFDFGDVTKIDCLVCHEKTGTYKKFPSMAGNPVAEPTVFPENKKEYLPPDWNAVAQSVGRPTRQNCGVCHFFGGGGDAVKHGDLDSSLFKPAKTLDVHMGSKESGGQNFDCARCHTTRLHNIAGRIYSTPASKDRKSLVQDDLTAKIMCESCHTATPHRRGSKANDHTDKVACQACHIPQYARVVPTKMSWDWSTAGKLKDGKPYAEKDERGLTVYDSKKGSFVWEKNVVPEYYWFNGSITSTTAKDVIDPSKPVKISWPKGDRNDPKARIMPFKVHRGKQPYDVVNKTFVVPHLFGPDETAYWKGFDWQSSIAAGMAYSDLPYSGQFDFVATEYVYPITHMVAPKEQTLACGACHSRKGRLADLGGFYMPGRDRLAVADLGGWAMVGGTLAATAFHGLMRLLSRSRKEDKQ
jgi:octaheme c-type cytochrome (tetrathionate reductase family)